MYTTLGTKHVGDRYLRGFKHEEVIKGFKCDFGIHRAPYDISHYVVEIYNDSGKLLAQVEQDSWEESETMFRDELAKFLDVVAQGLLKGVPQH